MKRSATKDSAIDSPMPEADARREIARLKRVLQQRDRELSEALEQQKATSGVLKTINRSPLELQAVLAALVEHAVRLCAAESGVVYRFDGSLQRLAAAYRMPPAFRNFVERNPLPPGRGTAAGRAVLERRTVHIPDVTADPDYDYPAAYMVGNVRTILGVPMLRNGESIGVMTIWRSEHQPFTDRQVELLTTFADQAVIAIENARLFNEIQEALEHLTATSDVLRVISGSMANATPVFEKILDTCERLFGASDLAVFLVDAQDRLNVGACRGGFAEWAPRTYPRPLAGTMSEVAIRHGSPLHWADVAHEPGIPAYIRDVVPEIGNLSVVVAPLMWQGRGIGTIDVMRRPPRPYSEKELALIATFADQAVIAIQNARVLSETREALEQQRASSEVLATISSSISDAAPVFEKILQSCKHLFGSDETAVLLIGEQEQVNLGAYIGRFHDEVAATFPAPLDKTPVQRAIRSGRVAHFPEIATDPSVTRAVRGVACLAGYRSMAYAPMMWNGRGIGAIGVSRTREGGFTDKELATLQTFADQAVIAIQNAHLFKELEARNLQLTESLGQQTATAEILEVISNSPTDVQPVFDAIASSGARLFQAANVALRLVVAGDRLNRVAFAAGPDSQMPDDNVREPIPIDDQSFAGRAVLQREAVHEADVFAAAWTGQATRARAGRMGYRAVAAAPILREAQALGAVIVLRSKPMAFTRKEVALLRTFADQAAIAIGNARLFQEIQEKSHQLEIANQHKSAFLANMSHELRTPLNAVIGFSQMLAARYFGDLTDKQAEYVDDIIASGKHLLSLINDILDLSKIEAGRMELDAADFDLRSTLGNALTLVRERAQRGAISLQLEIDPALGTLRGDERKLKQVVVNLLSNAVKFTPPGGEVRVVARQLDGGTQIAVCDNGAGIAPQEQEAIFEAFRQVGADVTRKREGTGLGLTLSRRFVELHGGSLRVESAPGRGSTFTISLPVRHGE